MACDALMPLSMLMLKLKRSTFNTFNFFSMANGKYNRRLKMPDKQKPSKNTNQTQWALVTQFDSTQLQNILQQQKKTTEYMNMRARCSTGPAYL